MWYYYDLSTLKVNKIKDCFEDVNKIIQNIINLKKNYYLKKYKNSFDDTALESKFEKLKECYLKLSQPQKNNYKKIFETNILIEKSIKKILPIYTYDDLNKMCGEEMQIITKDLCDYLYKNLKETKGFSKLYISPKKYYEQLKEKNIIKGICPFCGRNEMALKDDSDREDYDHYLPKSKYPFVSLTHKNLVPMCSKCNSRYKLAEDPLKHNKLYYPFDITNGTNSLNIKEIKKDKINEIEIINENGKVEENETWDKIFEIKKRSLNKLNDNFKVWYDDFIEEINDLDIDFELCLKSKVRRKKKNLYNENNLFKESFYRYLLKETELKKLNKIFQKSREIYHNDD